jgi:hypothetical protein
MALDPRDPDAPPELFRDVVLQPDGTPTPPGRSIAELAAEVAEADAREGGK